MSDKRKVTTDALETLGSIIDENAGRDAIHLAVEPVIAGERLKPGEDIGLLDGKAYNNSKGNIVKLVGIVDPFIKGFVDAGERFWLIVYPRQITSLRHVWEHPDFTTEVSTPSGPTAKEISEQWLRDWCDRVGEIDYEDLIGVMTGGTVTHSDGYGQLWTNEGDYLLSHGRGNNYYGEIPLEVWVHLGNVTGKKFSSHPTHFSCSC